MFPVLFHLGPFTLHTYGLMVAVGFLLALKVARRGFQQRGLPLDMLDPLVFYLMVGGLLGARTMYFAVNGFSELKTDPWQFFRIWEGGLVLYGGVLVGLLALVVFSYRRNIQFFLLTDVMADSDATGTVHRSLGMLFAGCCYGRPTNSWFHVTFRSIDSLAPLNIPLHPTQLYESAGDFLLFLGLMRPGAKQSAKPGVVTALYLVGYGLFRFFMEFLRGDDRGLGWRYFSPSQMIALVLIVTGAVVWMRANGKKN